MANFGDCGGADRLEKSQIRTFVGRFTNSMTNARIVALVPGAFIAVVATDRAGPAGGDAGAERDEDDPETDEHRGLAGGFGCLLRGVLGLLHGLVDALLRVLLAEASAR